MSQRDVRLCLSDIGQASRDGFDVAVPRAGAAVDAATRFIRSESALHGGRWSDYSTNSSGESTSWVTAHVLLKAGRQLPESESRQALALLISERGSSGGWGFSAGTPPDCDSTAHCLMAILVNGAAEWVGKAIIEEATSYILAHQLADGGFATYTVHDGLATYRQGKDEGSYSGWMQSHGCVTAAVAELLTMPDRVLSSGSAERAMDFLLARQHPAGYWRAYWWRSLHYTTARLLPLFWHSPVPERHRAAKMALSWLLRCQRAAGFWDNGIDRSVPCALSTAFCVNAFVRVGRLVPEALRAVEWLVSRQLPDGSWPTRPALQMPPPSTAKPHDYRDWRMDGLGVGACCRDKRAVYTTATVLGALSSFLREVEHGL